MTAPSTIAVSAGWHDDERPVAALAGLGGAHRAAGAPVHVIHAHLRLARLGPDAHAERALSRGGLGELALRAAAGLCAPDEAALALQAAARAAGVAALDDEDACRRVVERAGIAVAAVAEAVRARPGAAVRMVGGTGEPVARQALRRVLAPAVVAAELDAAPAAPAALDDFVAERRELGLDDRELELPLSLRGRDGSYHSERELAAEALRLADRYESARFFVVETLERPEQLHLVHGALAPLFREAGVDAQAFVRVAGAPSSCDIGALREAGALRVELAPPPGAAGLLELARALRDLESAGADPAWTLAAEHAAAAAAELAALAPALLHLPAPVVRFAAGAAAALPEALSQTLRAWRELERAGTLLARRGPGYVHLVDRRPRPARPQVERVVTLHGIQSGIYDALALPRTAAELQAELPGLPTATIEAFLEALAERWLLARDATGRCVAVATRNTYGRQPQLDEAIAVSLAGGTAVEAAEDLPVVAAGAGGAR